MYWGVSHKGINIHNVPLDTPSPRDGCPVLVMSSSEDLKLQNKFNKKFNVIHATGAGYKLLVVALGYAAACVSSKVKNETLNVLYEPIFSLCSHILYAVSCIQGRVSCTIIRKVFVLIIHSI